MQFSTKLKTVFFFICLIFSNALISTSSCYANNSTELTPVFTLSNNKSSSAMTDDSHSTSVNFKAGDTITITAKDGSTISGMYICWDSIPAEWSLTIDEASILVGSDGFLHEYVEFPTGSKTAIIEIPKDDTRIDSIRIFKKGELPPDVQTWNPSPEKADIMVISTHADDEILFMGGVLTNYAYFSDAEIQVVYLCEFWSTDRVREHEKLDGLWEAGIRNYPTCGNFIDKYAKSLTAAKKIYKQEEVELFFIEQIRRFKPQVIVTHDIYGEYGHGAHILTCHALLNAIEDATIESIDSKTAEQYGVWNTPKTYLHLFPANQIRLDLHIPIEKDYKGRTALEILKAAYKKHKSQQWCDFYVSDDYEHSCADFGLYRTTVGLDTSNDLLCNIKTYAVQKQEELHRQNLERLAEEALQMETEALRQAAILAEQRKAEEAAKLEAERLAKEEAERLEKEATNAKIKSLENKIDDLELENTRVSNSLTETKESLQTSLDDLSKLQTTARNKTILLFLLSGVICLLCIVTVCISSSHKKSKTF